MRINYVFTGEEEMDESGRYIIPENVTHASVHPSVKIIPAEAFYMHENIVEFICHDGVEKIEEWAFSECALLKRVIMRGVKIVEQSAFYNCYDLTDVECRKLELIGAHAFALCGSLRSIDLTSAKVVEEYAFDECEDLEHVAFGRDLESLGECVFGHCRSLERITLPLKHCIIADNDVFENASESFCVDLVDKEVLYKTIDALQLEEWRKHIRYEIDLINLILPVKSGSGEDSKARAIRWWITSVLLNINHFKAEHRNLLNDAATILEHAVPKDIVMKHVLPFLELPSRDDLKERGRKRQRDET